MTPQRWQHINGLLEAALDLPEASRQTFLKKACGPDRELYQQVLDLLAADAQGTQLKAPLFKSKHPSFSESQPTAPKLDAYRILNTLGRGGMGTVYLGERSDGSFEKRVAIKVVHPAFFAEDLTHRFRAERHILAQLDHPYIARLLDAGTTAEGAPFFVMEYVDGIPITTFCQKKKNNLADILKLFCKVCEAVQFAHQNLVIHRDIKPGNILVTEDGNPKLLDFGIAKQFRDRGSQPENTATVTGYNPMTPAYASPEQIAGDRITTSSDVYSLGVVFYQLLTGQKPYYLPKESAAALEEAICRQSVEKPSRVTALEPVMSSADWSRRKRLLKGDLDTIALKALRKEPQRRYGSPREFAEDVQRFLTGQAVRARKNTWFYTGKKFLLRHKWGSGLTLATLGLIFLFNIFLAMQSQRLLKERNKSQKMATFFVELFTLPDKDLDKGRQVTAGQLLDRGALRVNRDLANQPESQALMKHTLGTTYRELGLYDEALPLLETALTLREKILTKDHPDVLESVEALAELTFAMNRMVQSTQWTARAYKLRVNLFGENHPLTIARLGDLARLYTMTGRRQEAERLALSIPRLEKTLSRALEKNPGPDSEIAKIHSGLGHLYRIRGEPEKARLQWSRALAFLEAHGREKTLEASHYYMYQAWTYQDRLQWREAEAKYLYSAGIRESILGRNHCHVAECLYAIGELRFAAGDFPSAQNYYCDALDIQTAFFGNDHMDLVRSENQIGLCLREQGMKNQAVTYLSQGLERSKRIEGTGHGGHPALLFNLAELLLEQNRPEQAEPYLKAALAMGEGDNVYRPVHMHLLRNMLGACRAQGGALEEGLAMLSESFHNLSELLPPGHKSLLQAKTRRDRYAAQLPPVFGTNYPAGTPVPSTNNQRKTWIDPAGKEN